jgi:ankyrin repeat protein
MARVHVVTLIMLLFALAPRAVAQTAPAGADLKVEISPTKDDLGRLTIKHHEHFNVLLTNRSDKPIRLWYQFCEPGHDTLNFRITDKNGNSWTMRRVPLDDYWDNFPLKTITIAAGETYVWRVEPTQIQGTWSWTGVFEPNSGEDLTIVPLFEIKADAQTKEHGIWTGRVEGQAVKVRVVNPKLVTPHDYLWSQCPKQALKIMQADPKWVNKKDSKDSCTPLHHASRFGFVEVIDWMLANGADVDARAYNNLSPLYFADEPAVVRALLRHKPKDKERALEFFLRPLEHAVEQIHWGGAYGEKWREIVQLMLDAGAPYSIQVAIYLNDAKRVREALKENPGLVNSLNGSRFTPLRVAAGQGHAEICKILLEYKADPNDWKNRDGLPIIANALKHPAIVKLLIEAGADTKTRISYGSTRTGIWLIGFEATALHYAAQAGAFESAKLLLDTGVDVNAKDTYGYTALDVASKLGNVEANRGHIAATWEFGEVAHLLASRMGTVEARDVGWSMLLQQLVFSAKTDRLKQVLQEKVVADIFAQVGPAFMKTAAYKMQVTETKRHDQENARRLAIIETLHTLGIPIDIHSAIASDNIARVKELLKADPTLAKSTAVDKRPVLHQATALDRRAIVVLLLDAGAGINDPDDSGYTALHSAAFWSRPEIARLLIDRRADVNARAKNGFTPLHEAARLESVEVAKLLLAAGAKVNAIDNEGRTSLHWARFGKESDVIKLLTEHGGKD